MHIPYEIGIDFFRNIHHLACMKSKVLLLCFCTFSSPLFALDGSLSYQNTEGVGKEKMIFCLDPSEPLNNGRVPISGSGFWAELWYAQGAGKSEADLQVIPNSRVEFRTGTTAGLMKGISKLSIPGTLGGDHVTLQLRVWDNRNGTIQSWAETFDGGRTRSNLITDFQLGGVDATGAPVLGDGNVSKKIEYYIGTIVCPEPSVMALSALGIGMLLFRRKR